MYTPLAFINDTHGFDYSNENTYETYIQNSDLPDVDNISETEFLRFVLSPEFLTDFSKNCPYRNLNKALREATPEMIANLRIKPEDMKTIDPITEWRDVLVAHIHFQKWAEFKQVYKPDRDFCTALANTEKINMSKEILSHLPINTFYLDLSDLDDDVIHGCFVLLDHDETSVYLTIYALTHDLIFFSHHLFFNFSSKDDMLVKTKTLEEIDPTVIGAISDIEPKRKLQDDYTFSFRKLTTIVLNTLMYLGSSEPDIQESALTKSTYKPRQSGAPIKNKFSELQIFEMGYKYGSAFRKKLKNLNLETRDIEFMTAEHEKTRKSPTPHLRCAHWAHRWYGHKNSQKLKLVWIEPCFVGFGETEHTADIATIHKIE